MKMRITALFEENGIMEDHRQILRQARVVLTIPDSISVVCLNAFRVRSLMQARSSFHQGTFRFDLWQIMYNVKIKAPCNGPAASFRSALLAFQFSFREF